jgi:hypothetical protein
VHAPHLHHVLRAFCLAGFARLGHEAEQPREVPFVVEERASGFYAYRPLVRDLVHASESWLASLEDARIAVDELLREPAARIFTANAGDDPARRRALFRSVLLPLLARTTEVRGGLDWDDGAFERAYAELEQSLFGADRVYGAVAPVVGVSVGAAVPLARGIRVRPSSPDELTGRWSEAKALLPSRFGLEPERTCVLELERELPADERRLPDAIAEFADCVTVLRLATGAPVAAGPAAFERLHWYPLDAKPMLGVAATEPAGEPTRLDPWRAGLATELLEQLARAEADPELGEALERWELALFEGEPHRSDRMRESLTALLGRGDGLWAAVMRAAVLLRTPNPERMSPIRALRALARGDAASDDDAGAADAVRRACVETLLHEDRERLIAALDDALLGLRARPASFFGARSIRHKSGTAAS